MNRMNVIVFGSTGTVGKQLIKQSLENGHQVSAFCRDKSKLTDFELPNLKVLEGNVLNLADVKRGVENQDVVIITLGSGKDRKSTVRSVGTKNIVSAMEALKVKRLICQSTLGTAESIGNLNFFWKRIMFGWFLKDIFLDHELQEKYVKESDLNWTIVRPAAFTDGEKTGQYFHGFNPNDKSLKLKISRADVADFVIKQIGDNSYLRQTPGLSY
jgi:putative NADH-flavin reductase